jgi:hypothetical protein
MVRPFNIKKIWINRIPFDKYGSTVLHFTFTPGFKWGSWCSIFSFCIVFCRSLFVLFLLPIVLSVLLRFTASSYSLGILHNETEINAPFGVKQQSLTHSIPILYSSAVYNIPWQYWPWIGFLHLCCELESSVVLYLKIWKESAKLLINTYSTYMYEQKKSHSSQVDMSLHSDTLSRCRTKQSLFLLLGVVCWAENHQIPIL